MESLCSINIILLSRSRRAVDRLRCVEYSNKKRWKNCVCPAALWLLLFDRSERVQNVSHTVCVCVCAHRVYVSIRQREIERDGEKEIDQ